LEKVIFKKEVLEYTDELVFILFKENYFNYAENALLNVDKIVDFILFKISVFPHKKTPKLFVHLGSNYIFTKLMNVPLGTFFLKSKRAIT
jgi:hypothetical protein